MNKPEKKISKSKQTKLQTANHRVSRNKQATNTESPATSRYGVKQVDPAQRAAQFSGKEKRHPSTSTSLFSESTTTTATSVTSATLRAIMTFQDSLSNIRKKATAGIQRTSDQRQEMGSTEATPAGTDLTKMVPDRLKIFVGTWNMYGRLLPINLATFLTPNQSDWHDTIFPHLEANPTHPYHILAIGTQECERDISESLFFSSKEVWEARLSEYLGAHYKLIKTETLAALHLAVFVWLPVSHYVRSVCSEHIKTGWANMVGNKGAVAISVLFGTRSILFINCHLTAHQSKLAERNANVHRILHELKIPDFHICRRHHSGFRLSRRLSHHNRDSRTEEEEHCNHPDETNVIDRFDHVFLFGDTNYRINAERSWVLESIIKGDYKALLKFDQLSLARSVPSCPLAPFRESPISFPPTYKFNTTATTEPGTPTSSTSSFVNPNRTTPPVPSPITPPSSAGAILNKPSSKRRLPSSSQVRRATAPAAMNTLCYDTSPKQRVPSWTDRILWHDRPTAAVRDVGRKGVSSKKTRKKKPKMSAKERKKLNEAYKKIQQRKGHTTSSSSTILQIPLQHQLQLQQWWKRKRTGSRAQRETVCWFYGAAMDDALIGVSDHMPVIGVFGVWFDEWQTKSDIANASHSEKIKGSSQAATWWKRLFWHWKANNMEKSKLAKAEMVSIVK